MPEPDREGLEAGRLVSKPRKRRRKDRTRRYLLGGVDVGTNDHQVDDYADLRAMVTRLRADVQSLRVRLGERIPEVIRIRHARGSTLRRTLMTSR